MSGEQVTPASKKIPATIRDCWGFMPKLVAGTGLDFLSLSSCVGSPPLQALMRIKNRARQAANAKTARTEAGRFGYLVAGTGFE
ncbi:hypothetical protein, partial [Mesorhizobium wenxiniae]|uniref:hypothetical protein n=1 Tax=Mesorhizobium wenxiniae TaxID=2014805 RepID=UPI00197D9B52